MTTSAEVLRDEIAQGLLDRLGHDLGGLELLIVVVDASRAVAEVVVDEVAGILEDRKNDDR